MPPAPGLRPVRARDEENAQLREQLTADAEVTGLRGQVADLKDRTPAWSAPCPATAPVAVPPSGMTRRAASRPASSGGRQSDAARSGTGRAAGGAGAAMTWTVPDDTFDYYPRAPARAARTSVMPPISASRGLPRGRGSRAEGSDIQHDLHQARCACGRPHGAPPARRPGLRSPSGRGLRLAVYCWSSSTSRWSGAAAAVRRGRREVWGVHPLLPGESCVDGSRDREADKALLIAARVVGFDETTLRSGAAGERNRARRVHRAVLPVPPRRPVAGDHDDFGILTDFTGIAVTDRYGNYFHATWKNISGHQACVQHLCVTCKTAETYPGTIWPAQRKTRSAS